MLAESVWQEQRRAHEARVDRLIDGQRERASRGQKHPVKDFLFTYYSFRPAWLRRWHPGPGVILAGNTARDFLRWSEYREVGQGVQIEPAALPDKRRAFARWLETFLSTTAARPAFFGCFGWHEWAMVYRQAPEEIRHNAHPLRFPPDEIARIVESGPGCCTHYDAFRFFTTSARPLNRLQPTRESAVELDQRGCLHANMDLYKWAYKLAPFTPSELIADCFELARAIREVDMRASPYDLQHLGYSPIKIEEAAGRTEYETLQRDFAAKGQPLRARLLNVTQKLTRKP
ncbi:3-methyladenine DNA glycosylase [Synoicihabitans lomoniglobus]|uniref:3-methyladenine DNA glycosylase n=1 Tax=Synoicihabitans lomoniglobus TaxID=2909285 RepID=A0AAE9ZW39_9BACT|nr:3-methyladenine DNA glycosylase [Opitutaceae bacterium LMO-M01]WED64169.1 3-methyladenine DNA glycosylase [Opitutaceae bacterium LMO-M01]